MTNTITVMAWFKTSDSAGGLVERYMDSGSLGYRLLVAVGGQIYFSINTSTTGFSQWSSGVALNDNAWHHAAGVYDGSVVKLYIDGSLVATSGAQVGTITNAGDNTRIGKSSDQGYYAGLIDDVRIYSRSLSATEILQIYNAGV